MPMRRFVSWTYKSSSLTIVNDIIIAAIHRRIRVAATGGSKLHCTRNKVSFLPNAHGGGNTDRTSIAEGRARNGDPVIVSKFPAYYPCCSTGKRRIANRVPFFRIIVEDFHCSLWCIEASIQANCSWGENCKIVLHINIFLQFRKPTIKAYIMC